MKGASTNSIESVASWMKGVTDPYRSHGSLKFGKVSVMAAYGLAIFTGAFLLFQVQPLMGKYLLPWFGGVPAVWTTCMLVFQVLLLAGYLYAHLSRRLLSMRNQLVVHLALLSVAVLTLPIVPAESSKSPDASEPTWRIVALLLSNLGLPYVVLAATAPLLQHWFTQTNPGQSPFRLYALSNAGSLLALITYPIFVETTFTRQAQATIWGAGLVVYALTCCWLAWQAWDRTAEETKHSATQQASSPLLNRIAWTVLPACGSLLLLAITNKTSQEVAVIPLLWILPLALYLLSFIICFDRPAWYDRRWFGPALMGCLLLLTLLIMSSVRLSIPAQVLAYNGCLFVCCMVCHGELYRLRPPAAKLTTFYLMIAFGGAIGGLFVGVIAPAVFPDYFELQIGLILCGSVFLALPVLESREFLRKPPLNVAWSGSVVLLLLLAIVLWVDGRRYAEVRVYRGRNFYGVLNVYRHQHRDPTLSLVELMHGQVAHGIQFLHPTRAKLPTLYYTEESGVGQAFKLLPENRRHVGIVGLGVGTLSAYAAEGDRFCFYEINPQVEEAARSYFTYLTDTTAQIEVVLGDARLSLEQESPQQFDLLVLDAFSSDAIPLHLLTREAFTTYERHLKSSGIIAVHISNQSVNLEPVVASLAKDLNMSASVVENQPLNEQWWVLPSTWVILSRDTALKDSAKIKTGARPARIASGFDRLWTDDYAALFPVLRWKQFIGTPSMDAEASARAGVNLAKVGDIGAAIARFREAVALNPNSAEALNNLACLLATAPDPALRDGTEAVTHAEKACELTGYVHPIMLSTLAAAYAQAGAFSEAASMAEKTCQIAEAQGDQELVTRNRRFLELYKSGQVYPYPGGPLSPDKAK